MIIIRKNEGNYIQYTQNGTRISFGDGALTLDLIEYAHDWPVQLDICTDKSGTLVVGSSYRYVAQISIPARSYTLEKGKADDFGFPQLRRIALPLDTDQVVLAMWAMEV